MIHGINFGHNRKWSAHSDMGLMEEARNVALPSLMRISSLAKSRVNRNGHAEFGPGEIASVLVIFDKKTGELKPMAKNQVANLIKQGKEAGIFDEESCARCIVICSRVVQRNTGTGSCKAHNINKSGNQIIEEEVVVKKVVEETKPAADTDEWNSSSNEEEADMTDEQFAAWIETIPEAQQDVAYYGMRYKHNDPLAKIVLVSEEAMKTDYDWCASVQVRYSYAADNVAYKGPAREKKELTTVGSDPFMEASW